MSKKQGRTAKPELHWIKIICSCGQEFKTLSTQKKNLKVEICSHCHPLYTGSQKLVDTTGQVEKFKARLKKTELLKAKNKAKKTK